MKNNYGGIVWTNHALSRMRERGIKQGDVWATFRRPDNSKYSKKKGVWVYHKKSGSQKIEVVAKQNEKKEWVILSVWSKPVHLKLRRKKKTLLRKLLTKIPLRN